MLSYFEAAATNYRRRSRAFPWKWLRRSELQTVMNEFEAVPRGGRVLDLGAGAGFYTEALQQAGFKDITAVDLLPGMLAQIQSTTAKKIRADIQAFRSDQVFDLIVCAGALEFVSRPEQVFANVSAMLSPIGRFVLLFPEVGFAGGLYQRFHARHDLVVRLYKPAEIERIAAEVGLRAASSIRCGAFSRVMCFHRF